MQNKILPTIGRVVLFNNNGIIRPGIITEVVDAEVGIISVFVMEPTEIMFKVSINQGNDNGQWDWMPFQKDQQSRLGWNQPAAIAGTIAEGQPSEPSKEVEPTKSDAENLSAGEDAQNTVQSDSGQSASNQ